MATRAEINQLYQEILGRPAGEYVLGDRQWQTPEQIRADLLASPEYQEKTLAQAQVPVAQPIQQIAPDVTEALKKIVGDIAPVSRDVSAAAAAQAREQAASERERVIQDILGFAPRVQDIRRAAEPPEVSAIRDLLGSQIRGELEMGTEFTPEEERLAEQSIRSAQAARGLLRGRSGARKEAVKKTLEGLRLRDIRQGKASAFLSAEGVRTPSPVLPAGIGTPSVAIGAQAGQSPFSVAPTVLGAAQTQQQIGVRERGQQAQLDLFRSPLFAPMIRESRFQSPQPYQGPVTADEKMRRSIFG